MDRLERLCDLVLVLLDTKRLLTLNEIVAEVGGYPQAEASRRQAFERDKRTLRDEGIPLTMGPIPGDPTQTGYRIVPEEYYLPDLGLALDEQVALNLAVAGVHLDDPTGRDALLKLGVMERDAPVALAALPALPALPALHQALRSHAAVSFVYRGRQRMVDPHALAFRHGRWYLMGLDHNSQEPRTFRVDRMSAGLELGPEGSFVPPAGATVADQAPWRLGGDEVGVAEVLVDHVLADGVAAQLGPEGVVERRPDNSIVVRLAVVNVGAFRSWVLGLLDHAVVLGPPVLRQAVTDWLEAMLS